MKGGGHLNMSAALIPFLMLIGFLTISANCNLFSANHVCQIFAILFCPLHRWCNKLNHALCEL
jgi:hypothetical protein